MSPGQLLGIAGGVLMIVAPFLPFASSPIAGVITWFEGARGVAIGVAIMGVGTIILALRNQMRALWIPGGVSLLLAAYSYYDFRSALGEMKQGLENSLAGSPFGLLADAAAGSVQLRWGLPVALVGALLAIAAAALKARAPSQVPAAT